MDAWHEIWKYIVKNYFQDEFFRTKDTDIIVYNYLE